MEENKTKVTPLNSKAGDETAGKQTIDKAQFEAVVRQAEGRMQQLVEQMRQLDQMLRDKTVDQMFEVLKYSIHFDTEFVDKCAKCLENYFTKIAFSNNEESEESDVESKEGE